MISVYITCPNMAEAKKISNQLLEQNLIACSNMFPIQSMYKWKGKLVDEGEVAMLCKAKKDNFKKIEVEVKKMHSYDVPCIIAFDWVDSNKDFSDWVEASD